MINQKQYNRIALYAFIGGLFRLAGQIAFTCIGINGVWFIAECLSDVFFWAAFISFFKKGTLKNFFARVFMSLAMNDLIDQCFFDPNKLGWNEIAFGLILIIVVIHKLYTCRRNK